MALEWVRSHCHESIALVYLKVIYSVNNAWGVYRSGSAMQDASIKLPPAPKNRNRISRRKHMSPRHGRLQRLRCERLFTNGCKDVDELGGFDAAVLLPKRWRGRLLHGEIVAGVKQGIGVFRALSNAHLHADGHGHEDVETSHLR